MAKTSTKGAADPVFAAINRHRLAWDHQEKVGREHTKAETKAARTKDGEKTPEFRAIDRKWDAAMHTAYDQMGELIKTRPRTIEGAAAQAAYVRAIEKFSEGAFSPCADDESEQMLDFFGRNLKRLVKPPHSAEYESVLAAAAELEAEEKKRHARWLKRQKRYKHSKKAKRDNARIRKLTGGPTVIEVATEAKTLQRVAALITAMMPPDGERMIQAVKENAKRPAERRAKY